LPPGAPGATGGGRPGAIGPAHGINLPVDPDRNQHYAAYEFDYDLAPEWDRPVDFGPGEFPFSSGAEDSRDVHQAREEDITLHEPHLGDQAMIDDFGGDEALFESREWDDGPGLLFDEPLAGDDQAKQRTHTASPSGARAGESASGHVDDL